MEFRTIIPIKPLQRGIDHSSSILSLGSCFADNMAQRLSRVKFDITASPTGILFNPESIADAIERMVQVTQGNESRLPQAEELQQRDEVWFNYDFHSSFSHTDAELALQNMKAAVSRGAKALAKADTIIITFGSAFVYRLNTNGKVVGNCHKQPQSLFTKEMLSAQDIAARYISLIKTALADKHIILTVSPIRHMGDGAEQNSLSKATLRVATGLIAAELDNVSYFPSYEIMYDELRDYRFYDDDMIHPSKMAIDYIWQRFAEVAFSDNTRQVTSDIERIIKASEHRPLDAQSDAHKRFCTQMIEQIAILQTKFPAIDMQEEKESFNTYL